MTMETTKESICINRQIGQKSETRIVEEDSIVPDIKPDILSVIMANGNVFIYKKEILDDKVRLDGTVQIYTVYLSDNAEGNIRTLQTNIDFSETFPFKGALPGMDLLTKVIINSIDAKILNGRKISLRVSLNFNLRLFSNDNIDIVSEITGMKDLQKLTQEIEVNSLIGNGNTKAIAKETIAIDPNDNLAEIMNVEIKIANRGTKISYNKVLAKADCSIRILYMTEDNRIKSVESTIPIMGFIDITNVLESHMCDTEYEIKNCIIKLNGDEDHSIYAEIETYIVCNVFERKRISYIEDLYSPTNNINFTEKQIKTMCEKLEIKDSYSLREKKLIPEINGSNIYYAKAVPDILTQELQNGKIKYEGNINLNIFLGNESRVETKNITVPFKHVMDANDGDNNNNVQTEIEVIKQDFSILPDGQLDIEIDMTFVANISSFSDVSVINDITESDEKKESKYSLIIYFVKPGDTIWKIAKNFGSTVEEITNINDLENLENLLNGSKLYIPRHSSIQPS